jgi:hypothetical protein
MDNKTVSGFKFALGNVFWETHAFHSEKKYIFAAQIPSIRMAKCIFCSTAHTNPIIAHGKNAV